MAETTETIICPECNLQQVATVKQTVPWKTYIHVCEGCGYIIGESEWNVAKKANRVVLLSIMSTIVWGCINLAIGLPAYWTDYFMLSFIAFTLINIE